MNSSSQKVRREKDAHSKPGPENGTPKTDEKSETNEAPDPKGDAENDPAWYDRNAPLVSDAANIPYSNPLGDAIIAMDGNAILRVSATGSVTVKSQSDYTKYSIPGILTLKTKPSFGSNDTIKDPVNVAATMLYTELRYNNSGRKNYDMADSFIYCASMADVYSFIVWVERIYAKAFVYSQRNKYVGQALLDSENIDSSSIVNNLANLRYWLNSYIHKVAAFAVPASIMYFQRRAWMYSHVYLENPDANIKDQMYQFTPDGFYHYNLDSTGAGMLEYKTISDIIGDSSPIDYNDLRTIGEWLVSNIVGDEDFGLISGDVLRAFGVENIIHIVPLDEYLDFVPVYDEYVLLQMKNADVVDLLSGSVSGACAPYYTETLDGTAKEYHLGNLYQSFSGLLKSQEGVELSNMHASHTVSNVATVKMNKIFDLNTPNPQPVDTMEISRLKVGYKDQIINDSGSNRESYVLLSTGADVVVGLRITSFRNDGRLVHGYRTDCIYDANDSAELAALLSSGAFNFTYMPHIYKIGLTSQAMDTLVCLSNIANYSIQPSEVLQKMHEVAMLSLFYVPGIAKMINSFNKE